MRGVLNNFYAPHPNGIQVQYVDDCYFVMFNHNSINVYSGSRIVLRVTHKQWGTIECTDTGIGINGNIPMKLPGTYNVFLNSRLTKEKYSTIVQSPDYFNYMIENSDKVPSYETCELCIGIRKSITDLKLNSLTVSFNPSTICWRKLRNTEVLFRNTGI